MKKLLLTASAALTILFAQAQTPCEDFSYMQNGPTTIFTDLSTVNASWSTNYSVTWEWDFGDGTPVSTQQNPVHTYANNGIYTPCLTVTYFDSTIINYCISVSCDSILVGNSIPASWDCNPTTGCYDPGTGLGTYTSLSSCQSNCQLQMISPCDSIDIVGSQSQLTMEVMSGTNVNSPLYIVTTDFNGYIVGEDSLTWTHDAWPIMALTDSIITCITYVNGVDTLTCCVEFFWNGSFWAKMGSVTSIGEIGSFDKKLIKVVDILGRETSINSNQTLFFIYEDGTIEKRYIIDRK